MAERAQYVSPYAARLAALAAQDAALRETPETPMFTPEQIAERTAANSRQQQIGILGQLSGNQQLGKVGGEVLAQALAEHKKRYTEHGEYDPLSGKLTVFPEVKRTQDQSRIDKEAQRLREDDAKGQQQWNLELQREDARKEMRQMVAGLAGNQDKGSARFTTVGDDGVPVYDHSRLGLVTRDASGNWQRYTGKSLDTRSEFGKENAAASKTDTGAKILDDVIGQVERNKTAFGGGYAGAAGTMLPGALRGIGAGVMFTPEELAVRADVTRQAYNLGKELAGSARSASETFNLAPFLPEPQDSHEVVLVKLQKMRNEYTRIGKIIAGRKNAATATVNPLPGGQVQTPPPNSGQSTQTPSGGSKPNVTRYDAAGNRIQ